MCDVAAMRLDKHRRLTDDPENWLLGKQSQGRRVVFITSSSRKACPGRCWPTRVVRVWFAKKKLHACPGSDQRKREGADTDGDTDGPTELMACSGLVGLRTCAYGLPWLSKFSRRQADAVTIEA